MDNRFDVVIVGGGVAGIYALYTLRKLGLSIRVLETGSGVGGTWYWNRYPGARCDADSVDYSFSFSEELQQEWDWPERFSNQAEIVRYLEHVVDRFDLIGHFQFGTRVDAAHYDQDKRLWRIHAGSEVFAARYLVMATGVLSAPRDPRIPGLKDFTGELHFTSRWPKQPVSFEGKRIGVVGTGSSGIQAIPVIAREAGRLTVFQRTANYSVPAQNGPHDPVWLADYKSRYAEIRAAERKSGFATYWSAFEVNPLSALEVTPEEREREYEWRWNRGGTGMMVAFRDLLTDLDANRTAADFVRAKIRDIVKDPETARKLQPAEDQPISCRRLCVDTGYYDTFNRPNVDLIHLGEDPIERITSHGVQTRSNSIELDMLILATGFDPVTGALSRIDIRGRDGIELKEKWKDGPRSYLGIVGSGFPNLFAVNGPLGVNGNFVTASELVVDWIAGLIRFAETNGYGEIDATKQAEDGWVEHVRVGADRMTALQTPTCNAWWAKRREADGRRIFLLHMEGIGEYMKLCDEIAAAGYRGFDFRA